MIRRHLPWSRVLPALLLAFTLTPTAGRAQSQRPRVSPAGSPATARPAPDAAGTILGPEAAAPSAGQRETAVAPLAPPGIAATLAGRAFTYQGLLRASGLPLNGTCDLQFSLWDASAGGVQQGSTQTVTTTVNSGLFTVTLNDADQFGAGTFDGRALWVAIAVRSPSGSGTYTPLLPRQPLAAAPLAAGLIPHSTASAGDTYSGFPTASINAPAGTWGNPMALQASAAAHSNYVGTFNAVGLWGDSGPGTGVWGSTNTGYALLGSAAGSGWAGYFEGNVKVIGKLEVPRFHTVLAINTGGPLPLTSSAFSTSGGTLVLSFSGSGFAGAPNTMLGMSVLLDGNFVDQTGLFANNPGMHLAFVSKQWVLTGIAAGSHTVTLTADSGTATDYNDIFNVTVTELPY